MLISPQKSFRGTIQQSASQLAYQHTHEAGAHKQTLKEASIYLLSISKCLFFEWGSDVIEPTGGFGGWFQLSMCNTLKIDWITQKNKIHEQIMNQVIDFTSNFVFYLYQLSHIHT